MEGGTPGCLVAVGDSFIYARARAAALPRGTTLSALVEGAASLQAAQDLFDCEISYGRRQRGDWRIERSSHCFREGAALSPVFEDAAHTLTIDDVTPDGAPIRRTWRIIAQEGAASLPRWFAGNDVHARRQPSHQAPTRKLEMSGVIR
jgi:hypothetical protein